MEMTAHFLISKNQKRFSATNQGAPSGFLKITKDFQQLPGG